MNKFGATKYWYQRPTKYKGHAPTFNVDEETRVKHLVEDMRVLPVGPDLMQAFCLVATDGMIRRKRRTYFTRKWTRVFRCSRDVPFDGAIAQAKRAAERVARKQTYLYSSKRTNEYLGVSNEFHL